jgi:hypothetical protein
MFSQPIDEVSCYHRLSHSKIEAEESLTRYQKENGFVFAGDRDSPPEEHSAVMRYGRG